MPLPELFARAAASPEGPVDVDRLWRTGRNRRRRAQAAAGGGIAATAAVVALVLPGVLGDRTGGVGLIPGPGEPPPSTAPPETRTLTPIAPTPSVTSTATPADWRDLTLAQALDRLIEVNESVPSAPEDGVRVTRTVWAGRGGDDGTGVSAAGVSLHEIRKLPDGSVTIADGPVAAELDPNTSVERLREITAATDLDSIVLEVQHYPAEEWRPADLMEAMFAEAEALAAVPSAQPQENETERRPHARAANNIADLLQESVPSPRQRIRALRVLATLDPEFVEYDGVVEDLLGREGIGITLLDPVIDTTFIHRNTLIFSPDTGAQLGRSTESAPPPSGLPAHQGWSAILSAEIVPE